MEGAKALMKLGLKYIGEQESKWYVQSSFLRELARVLIKTGASEWSQCSNFKRFGGFGLVQDMINDCTVALEIETLSSLSRERAFLLSIYRGETLASFYREGICLLSIEKTDSLPVINKESFSFRHIRETLSPPYREGVCLLFINKRETPSPLNREAISLYSI